MKSVSFGLSPQPMVRQAHQPTACRDATRTRKRCIELAATEGVAPALMGEKRQISLTSTGEHLLFSVLKIKKCRNR